SNELPSTTGGFRRTRLRSMPLNDGGESTARADDTASRRCPRPVGPPAAEGSPPHRTLGGLCLSPTSVGNGSESPSLLTLHFSFLCQSHSRREACPQPSDGGMFPMSSY